MRTVALRTCALVLRRKLLHGRVLRFLTPTGRDRTGRAAGDGSDPTSGRPGSGAGRCVFSHPTAPARSLPSMYPCGNAGGPMRLGTLVQFGAPLGVVLGNASAAPSRSPSATPRSASWHIAIRRSTTRSLSGITPRPTSPRSSPEISSSRSEECGSGLGDALRKDAEGRWE